MYKFYGLFVFTLLFSACQSDNINPNAEVVYARVETDPVSSEGDAADDPAIWVNTEQPNKSLILGTDKKLGLAVYNLSGEQVQFLERGRLNNVDLRQGVKFSDGLSTIAVATNRTNRALDIFSISSKGVVEHIYEQRLDLEDPYGLCMFLDADGQAHVFANSKNGEYQQWLLNPNGELFPTLLATFALSSQPEGCSVDDETSKLYVGEEEVGIWMLPADLKKASQAVLIDQVGLGNLTADVEGMEVYRDNQGRAYLIVSSQGDNSYALYDLIHNNAYLGSIRIADGLDGKVDGTQETDGLSVTSIGLGENFSKGMLVVQDGYNSHPEATQNFKLIPWDRVEKSLGL